MKELIFFKIKSGDLVFNIRQHVKKPGIVISSNPSNNYPSRHADNVTESYSWNHYVLFDNFIEGPFLSGELTKVI